MISSFYTAATGTIQLQKGFDVTANNIANVSTNGYKASTPSFADLIYTNMNAAAGANTDLKSGHGTKLQKTDTVFTQGSLQETQQPFDYAPTKPNEFFAVEKNGQIKYTRNGNFHISAQQNTNYLVDSEGSYVLNSAGRPITVANEQEKPNIGVFSFDNCDGLSREGNTYFSATNTSGAAKTVAEPELKKGWLEGSAANVADEMVSVIELQRSFQFNSKIVQLSDEIMQTVNGLR